MKCSSGCIASDLITWLRVVPMWIGAIVAILGYRIGRKYFNKGQRNVVELEGLKRFYNCFDLIKAELIELERIQAKLLNNSYPAEEVDALLQTVSTIHSELDSLTRKAMFIEKLVEFRNDYLDYYETWFLDSKGIEVFYEQDAGIKSKALQKIKVKVEEEFNNLKSSLDKAKVEKEISVTMLEV